LASGFHPAGLGSSGMTSAMVAIEVPKFADLGNTRTLNFAGLAVSGLTTGSTVSFNGIRVGQVSGLKIDPDRPNRIIATIAVDQSTPMRTDTKASLAFQGLTGVATIELSGGSADAKPLPGPPSHPPAPLKPSPAGDPESGA